MKHIPCVAAILVILLISFPSYSQDTAGGRGAANGTAPAQIQTGDTLSGIKYFLKILPADTSKPDQMPTIPPSEYVAVDVQPVPLKQVTPKYPENARKDKVEGTVWIKVLVSREGGVVRAEVMKTDAKILDQAAIDAAVQWTFTPARMDGKPVEVWAALPIRFKLSH